MITNIPAASVTAVPGQVSGCSTVHVGEQPSAGVVLLSSHSSPGSCFPLPHFGRGPPELELCALLALPVEAETEELELELDEDDDVPEPAEMEEPIPPIPPIPPVPSTSSPWRPRM